MILIYAHYTFSKNKNISNSFTYCILCPNTSGKMLYLCNFMDKSNKKSKF